MITIPAKTFAALVSAAAGVVEKKTRTPILADLLIESDGDRLTMTGTDLDRTARAEAAAEGAAFSACAGAAMLSEIAAAATDEVALSIDGAALVVSAGAGRWRLPTLPAGDFPRPEAPPAVETVDGAALAEAFGRVRHAISNEETRYYLNGIFLDPERLAVATDGHRLAAVPMPAVGAGGVILPRPAVDVALAAMKKARSIAAGHDARRFAIVADDGTRTVTMAAKLIDGSFPDWRRAVPDVGEPTFDVAVDAADLAAAVAAAAIAQTEGEKVVRLAAGDDALIVSARGGGGAEAEATMRAEVLAGSIDLGLNGRYLADILTLAGDTVRLRATAGAPVDIALRDGERHVIMPMRL